MQKVLHPRFESSFVLLIFLLSSLRSSGNRKENDSLGSSSSLILWQRGNRINQKVSLTTTTGKKKKYKTSETNESGKAGKRDDMIKKRRE